MEHLLANYTQFIQYQQLYAKSILHQKLQQKSEIQEEQKPSLSPPPITVGIKTEAVEITPPAKKKTGFSMADILTPDEKPSPPATPPSEHSISPVHSVPKIQIPLAPVHQMAPQLPVAPYYAPNLHALYAQQALLAQHHHRAALQQETSPPLDTRPKRVRTIFTQSQIDRLEVEFSKSQYMVGSDRVELAKDLDLSETQVKVWFQNRRIKSRKQKKIQNESTEERSESSDTESDTTAH